MQNININNESYLWSKFLSGDEFAFDRLYDIYYSKLYVYGYQITSNQELIRDCIQLIFIEFWQRRKKLIHVKNFKNYLFKSFRRKIIKLNKKYLKTVPLDHQMIENYHRSFEESFEDFLIKSQIDFNLKKNLHIAYQKLTTRQKEAVYFRFFENMTYQEISETMDFKDPKYARTIIYRSIGKLREFLQKLTPID